MSYRSIYIVEVLDYPGYKLCERRFFRNKRCAERAIGTYSGSGRVCYMRKLNKSEHRYLDLDVVEG